MERESIGIFITEHPLKRVREALKVKADCSTAEVINQRDGDWVKVGGMITESKKIQTRSGTLDDVRDARRPRRLGRDRGLREVAGRRRGA